MISSPAEKAATPQRVASARNAARSNWLKVGFNASACTVSSIAADAAPTPADWPDCILAPSCPGRPPATGSSTSFDFAQKASLAGLAWWRVDRVAIDRDTAHRKR